MNRLLARLLRPLERYTRTDMVYLAASAFWINLGSIAVSGFSFLLYLAFAHFLPKEVYGTYQYLLSVGAIVGAFTLMGMNNAVTRAVARGEEGSLRAAVRTQLLYGLLPLAGAWCAGAYYLHQGNVTLGWGLILIGIFVPVNNAFNTYGAFFGGRKDFRAGFFANLFTNVLYYPALIVAAYVSKSALILLAANLISQGIALAMLYAWVLMKYRPNDQADPETLRYGTHLSVMGFIGTVAGQLDSVLVFHFLGAAPLALYSFATGIPDRIANLTKFIQSAAFPKMANQDAASVRATIWPKLRWAFVGSGLITIAYMVFAHLFFALFFPAYMNAVPYSIVYALIIIPWATGIFTTALTAQAALRSLYVFSVAVPVTQIAFLLAGLLLGGLWGLIIARLIIAVVQLVFSAWLFFMSNHP